MVYIQKEWRKLVDLAVAEGWSVETTRNGHVVLKSPDTKVPAVILPSSPSDWRGKRNAVSLLRRAGLKIPRA